MTEFVPEKVQFVYHHSERTFSFTTSRDPSFRFENGQFVMLGLPDGGGGIISRAYSMASPNYEDYLEFYSIKVDGPFTKRLKNIKPRDVVYVGKKPVGSLVVHDVHPKQVLLLLATGTGLAPFMSLIRHPDTYERFEQVILVHSVRSEEDLAYREFLGSDIYFHPLLAEIVSDKLMYYPTVTGGKPFHTMGRIQTLFNSGKALDDLGLADLDPKDISAMICGSSQVLKDLSGMLDEHGFKVSPHQGEPGDYVIERAFVG